MAEIVLVTSRCTAHAGVNRDGTVMTFEACNLDQSRRCFPVKP